MLKFLPLNLDIIKNPYNWVVVILMVVIVGLGLHLVFAPASLPTTDGTQP